MKLAKKANMDITVLIKELRETAYHKDAAVWRDISEKLNRPRRLWSAVNLGHIERTIKDGETAIIPGKVLASGTLNKKVDVVAFSFSKAAIIKIESAGGRAVTLKEYLGENPEGKKTRIIG